MIMMMIIIIIVVIVKINNSSSNITNKILGLSWIKEKKVQIQI